MAADPYLQLTFDAKRRIALAARSVDLPPGSVAWGVWEVWEDVWRRKDARVPALVLAGCLGPDPRLPAALVAFGFLVVETDGGHRITLEDERRILWTHKQRVEAGKARAASGTRSAGGTLVHRSSDSPAADQRPASGSTSGQPAGHQRATSSYSQQPAASSQQLQEDHASEAGAAQPAHLAAQPHAQKPARRAREARQATNGAAPLVLEAQTPHEPARARQELVAKLGEAFRAERGTTYTYQGRDWKALDRLRESHSDAEIMRRWVNGLRAQYGQKVSDIWGLEQRWNANALPEGNGRAAAPGPQTQWAATGHCSLCNAAPGRPHESWCDAQRTTG
jgi:hypothetical protein